MVKKKKLKYQPIWDAVRSAYPDWMHNKVDELAGNFFGQFKFDRVQYQEKLAELQEKAAKRKRKSLLFWKKPAAKKAKTEKKPEEKQAAKPSETPESTQELPKEQAQKQKLPKPQPLLSPFWSTVSYPGHVSIFQRPKE